MHLGRKLPEQSNGVLPMITPDTAEFVQNQFLVLPSRLPVAGRNGYPIFVLLFIDHLMFPFGNINMSQQSLFRLLSFSIFGNI